MKIRCVSLAALLFWCNFTGLASAAELSSPTNHKQQETRHKLVFKGFTKEERLGIDVYIVEFSGYLEHSVLRDEPDVREIKFISQTGEDQLRDDLVRMLAYLNVGGTVRLEQDVFHIESPAARDLRSSDETELLGEVEPNRLQLSSARGSEPIYRIGETLKLLIELDRDAWVYCFSRQGDGGLVMLFPNLYHKLAWLDGGRKHEIAGVEYSFELKVIEPAGEETVFCLATDRNIDSELASEFQHLENASLPAGASRRMLDLIRDIPGTGLAEATLNITVIR